MVSITLETRHSSDFRRLVHVALSDSVCGYSVSTCPDYDADVHGHGTILLKHFARHDRGALDRTADLTSKVCGMKHTQTVGDSPHDPHLTKILVQVHRTHFRRRICWLVVHVQVLVHEPRLPRGTANMIASPTRLRVFTAGPGLGIILRKQPQPGRASPSRGETRAPLQGPSGIYLTNKNVTRTRV